jgi:hypothetical protein
MIAFVICPRCFRARSYEEGCTTPACQELQKDPSYLRDELEGSLHVAREQLKIGDTEHDWTTIVRELETELMLFDAHRGAAAFKQ